MKRKPMKNDEITGYENAKPKKTEFTWVNKNSSPHVIPAVAIISATIAITVIAATFVIGYVVRDIYNIKHNNNLDKFTYCLQTIMSESNKVNKPITAGEARDICSDLQKE